MFVVVVFFVFAYDDGDNSFGDDDDEDAFTIAVYASVCMCLYDCPFLTYSVFG